MCDCDKSILETPLAVGSNSWLRAFFASLSIGLLIDMGFSAVAIADRVGHESIEITYRYAHLFPSKQAEMADRVENYDKGIENLKTLEQVLDTSPEYQLPEPQGLMSAKMYKNKLAEPLVQKLKSLVKTALIRCFEAYDSYYRLNITNSNLHRENERLTKTNEKLAGENENLRAENKNYKLLKKAFGSKQMDSLLEQAKVVQQSKQRGKHFRNNQEER